jgi:hypothetical protein|uniref:Uncharacterized protein n=1 Tax=Siphoviridae sp. ctWKa2 TaxID=2825537 RepID=A0A8S5PF95_9CAUD|nr:MAG TPA: hypothetical protein [Siphoviridae sp. ctWKa2]
MYILNSNKLKNRPVWITWLFFNRRLQKDIKESIPILKEDISKLKMAEDKVHKVKMLSLELSIVELGYAMEHMLDTIMAMEEGWIPYRDISYLVFILKILDKTLQEVEFKKELSDV